MLHQLVRLENGRIRRTHYCVKASCDLSQLIFSAHLVVLLQIQLNVLLFILFRQLYLTAVWFQVELLKLEAVRVLFCHAETQPQVWWVVLGNEVQRTVDVFVDLLHVLKTQLVVCYLYAHLQVNVPTIRNWLSERYAQNLAHKEVLLPETHALPAHHELPNQPSMIASLLFMELNKQPLSIHLEQGHIERTLSRNVNILPINVVIDLRDFEIERGLQTDVFVLGEIRDEELLELGGGEGVDFEEAED